MLVLIKHVLTPYWLANTNHLDFAIKCCYNDFRFMLRKRKAFADDEKRETQRLHLPLTIVYKPADSLQNIKAICNNISGKGISVSTTKALTVGDIVEIILQPKNDKTTHFSAKGKVIWTKAKRTRRFEAGLIFTKVDQYDAFIEFICEKIVHLSSSDKS